MHIRPLVNQDCLGGLVFALFGAAVLWIGSDYPAGSARAMGPGFVPTIVGTLLVACGVGLVAKGILRGGAPLTAWSPRPILFIPLAFLVFAGTLGLIGYVGAAVAAMLVAALADRRFAFREQLVLAAISALVAWALFAKGLGLQFG